MFSAGTEGNASGLLYRAPIEIPYVELNLFLFFPKELACVCLSALWTDKEVQSSMLWLAYQQNDSQTRNHATHLV